MDKRERPIYKAVFFSEEEWQIVAKKMQEADIGSYSVFCREMLLNGECIYRCSSDACTEF